MTWLLLRLPSGALEVELDAFVTAGRILGKFSSRPAAVEAKEQQAQRDEREALRDAGQLDMFGGDDAA